MRTMIYLSSQETMMWDARQRRNGLPLSADGAANGLSAPGTATVAARRRVTAAVAASAAAGVPNGLPGDGVCRFPAPPNAGIDLTPNGLSGRALRLAGGVTERRRPPPPRRRYCRWTPSLRVAPAPVGCHRRRRRAVARRGAGARLRRPPATPCPERIDADAPLTSRLGAKFLILAAER